VEIGEGRGRAIRERTGHGGRGWASAWGLSGR